MSRNLKAQKRKLESKGVKNKKSVKPSLVIHSIFLETLPEDIQQLVFHLCGFAGRARCRSVCSSWKKLCDKFINWTDLALYRVCSLRLALRFPKKNQFCMSQGSSPELHTKIAFVER
jgi:hypothetical protein